MTTSTPDIREAWRVLQVDGGGSSELSLPTVPLEFDAGHGPVRVAIGDDGEPRMLIPTGSPIHPPEGLSGLGVSVRSVHFVVNARATPFLEVSCRLRELDEVFHSLTEEILRRLQGGRGALTAVAEALVEYRDLLRRERQHPLEWLTGLFGELCLLETAIERHYGAAATWTGPFRQRYDFSGSRACVEIKSTLKRNDAVVRVSSLEQLESPDDGRGLFLVHLCLERGGVGGRSTREIIEAIRTRAIDPDVVDRALHALRLDDWRESQLLAEERFLLFRRQVYEVRPGFPRLGVDSFRTDGIPTGVSAISYEIDLTHAGAFRVSDMEYASVLDRLVASA